MAIQQLLKLCDGLCIQCLRNMKTCAGSVQGDDEFLLERYGGEAQAILPYSGHLSARTGDITTLQNRQQQEALTSSIADK